MSDETRTVSLHRGGFGDDETRTVVAHGVEVAPPSSSEDPTLCSEAQLEPVRGAGVAMAVHPPRMDVSFHRRPSPMDARLPLGMVPAIPIPPPASPQRAREWTQPRFVTPLVCVLAASLGFWAFCFEQQPLHKPASLAVAAASTPAPVPAEVPRVAATPAPAPVPPAAIPDARTEPKSADADDTARPTATRRRARRPHVAARSAVAETSPETDELERVNRALAAKLAR